MCETAVNNPPVVCVCVCVKWRSNHRAVWALLQVWSNSGWADEQLGLQLQPGVCVFLCINLTLGPSVALKLVCCFWHSQTPSGTRAHFSWTAHLSPAVINYLWPMQQQLAWFTLSWNKERPCRFTVRRARRACVRVALVWTCSVNEIICLYLSDCWSVQVQCVKTYCRCWRDFM